MLLVIIVLFQTLINKEPLRKIITIIMTQVDTSLILSFRLVYETEKCWLRTLLCFTICLQSLNRRQPTMYYKCGFTAK